MQIRKNKSKISAITFALLFSAMLVTPIIPVGASGEHYTVKTFAYLACRPNPIGVGQTLLINLWLTPPTMAPGIPYHDYTAEITHPDGTVETIGPMQSKQADSTHWFEYAPTKVGNYELKFVYPGETVPEGTPIESYNPPYPITGYTEYTVTYSPSESPITTLVVQKEQIPGYQSTPLPNEYWARPITLENREWNMLLGDWYQTDADDAMSNFQPYGFAPNTAHIMWVKETGVSGQVGDQYGSNVYSSPQYTAAYVDEETGRFVGRQQYLDTVYKIKWAIAGIGFYQENNRLHAVDLRNGETLWVKEDISISALKSEEYITRAQGEPIVGYHPYILNFGSTFKKYSAQSGDLICDVPALRVSAYDNNRYAYSTQTISGQNYLIKWDTHDITEDFSKRIVYNVTYPLAGITGIWNDVGFYFGTGSAGVGTEELANIRPSGSFDLETGDILWTKNFTYDMTAFTGSANVLADGKYIYPLYSGEWDPENALRLMTAIDLYNGDQVWIGEPPDYPWGSFWCYSRAAAYGLAYFPSYTGYIIAYNTTTGEIEWKGGHSGSVGYETPYGYQPFFSSILVADDKVFAGNNEHSEGPPYYTGKKLWALDAHTGETIWNISFWLPGFGIQGIVADSMFIGTNYYDGRIYAFGKGSSETTVSIQNDVISHGNSVMIKGTVMDIAPATTQDVQVARFPNGVPAVSDESMSEWMEYVYMQKPKPTNATGVEVFLKIQDPNGEYYGVHVTTDEKGRFSHMWAPGVVGEYHVTAMFEGSESYYPSQETTTFGVDEAQAAEAGPSAEEIADTTVSKLPAYPDVPSASEVAQETVNQLPAYPEMPESPDIPEIPAYLTIDLVIIAAVAIAIIIGLYAIIKKQK